MTNFDKLKNNKIFHILKKFLLLLFQFSLLYTIGIGYNSVFYLLDPGPESHTKCGSGTLFIR